ncbi:hypothetical protein JCM17380_35340 [Desulfosporosinus burensis]
MQDCKGVRHGELGEQPRKFSKIATYENCNDYYCANINLSVRRLMQVCKGW